MSSPIVATVVFTPARCRICVATDSAMRRVDSRLVPSAARTDTRNCDSSSAGRKFLFATIASGTIDAKITSVVATTIHLCDIDQSSRRRYALSIAEYQRLGVSCSASSLLSQREAIIGVNVKLTRSEIAIATAI